MNRLVALVRIQARRRCLFFAEQSVRELNAGRVTCLIPRSQPPERRPAALAARPRGPGGRSADKRREVGKGLSLADTQTGR